MLLLQEYVLFHPKWTEILSIPDFLTNVISGPVPARILKVSEILPSQDVVANYCAQRVAD